MFQNRPKTDGIDSDRIAKVLSDNLTLDELKVMNEDGSLLTAVVNQALAEAYDKDEDDLPMPTQMEGFFEEKPRKSIAKKKPSFSSFANKGSVSTIRMHYEALFRANYPNLSPAKGNLGNVRSLLSMAGSLNKVRDYMSWVFANWSTLSTKYREDPTSPPSIFIMANYEKLWYEFESLVDDKKEKEYQKNKPSLMAELERLEAEDDE